MDQVSNSNAPVNYEPQTPVSVDMDAAAFSALVDASAKLKEKKPVITLTAEYIELAKPGESFRGIFIGFQDMQVTEEILQKLLVTNPDLVS